MSSKNLSTTLICILSNSTSDVLNASDRNHGKKPKRYRNVSNKHDLS